MQEVYNKDFDAWNEKKKAIDGISESIIFHNREIWWCSIGVNVDCEECGKNENFERPVLILQKLAKNKFYGIPLSTREQRFENFFYDFEFKNEHAYVLLDQMRVYSSNRLIRYIGKIKKPHFFRIKMKLVTVLDLEKIYSSTETEEETRDR